MARRQATDIENLDMKWHVIRLLVPYLKEYRARVLLAFGCLVLAKFATLSLPLILKYVVDGLDAQISGTGTAAGVLVAVPMALILAYGAARFANVIFNELRDTLFGRVTESIMRRL